MNKKIITIARKIWKVEWVLSGIICLIILFGVSFLPKEQVRWLDNAATLFCKIAVWGFIFEVLILWAILFIGDKIKSLKKKLKLPQTEKQKT